jgi:hypothetical protein
MAQPPVVATNFSLLQNVQNGGGTHTVRHLTGAGGFFSGAKRLGHEDDYPNPPNVEVKKERSYIFTSPYVLIACKMTT